MNGTFRKMAVQNDGFTKLHTWEYSSPPWKFRIANPENDSQHDVFVEKGISFLSTRRFFGNL